jgi:arylsulfatase A-like enzyme
VQVEDQVLAETLDVLRRAGRLDRTLVIVLADHGEGLPGDPVHQHDNNFFESGLHVPLVLTGPGVPTGRVDALTSLADVAPTALSLLGIASRLPDDPLRFGRSAFGHGAVRRIAPLACWNDALCEGYIDDRAKAVSLPSDDASLAFDRRRAFQEHASRAVSASEQQTLDVVHQALTSTHLRNARLSAQPLRLPSGFVCGPGQAPCLHPSRPEGGFH